MAKLRTHYDNLQVTENASPEVILGAYRYLSQKWHPDKNQDRLEEAYRVTKIINQAYAVLSDQKSRKEHDSWIATQRARTGNNNVARSQKTVDEPIRSFCHSCGANVLKLDDFCDVCGSVLRDGAVRWADDGKTGTGAPMNSDDFIRIFVGKNNGYYQKKWARMANTADSPTWNWAACFMSVLWLLYRKMYLYFFLILLLMVGIGAVGEILQLSQALQSVIDFGFAGALGMMGNSLYKLHVDKKIKHVIETYLNPCDSGIKNG